MRRRPFVSSIVTAVVLGLTVAGCGGGNDSDNDAATTAPPASQRPLGGGDGKPSNASGKLPPEFVKCMADQGFEVKSSAEVHSAPQAALQACFGALHQGGG